MQYALLIYENQQASYPQGEDSPAWKDIVSAHNAFAGELAQSGVMRGGAGLQGVEAATTVRVAPNGARTIHDGPFAETREQLGGFYLIEAADLDAAIAAARKLPVAAAGGSIEIRPCLEMPDAG